MVFSPEFSIQNMNSCKTWRDMRRVENINHLRDSCKKNRHPGLFLAELNRSALSGLSIAPGLITLVSFLSDRASLNYYLSRIVAAADNPCEWFKQEYVRPLRLRRSLSSLRKPVFSVTAAGPGKCEKFLDIKGAVPVL